MPVNNKTTTSATRPTKRAHQIWTSSSPPTITTKFMILLSICLFIQSSTTQPLSDVNEADQYDIIQDETYTPQKFEPSRMGLKKLIGQYLVNNRYGALDKMKRFVGNDGPTLKEFDVNGFDNINNNNNNAQDYSNDLRSYDNDLGRYGNDLKSYRSSNSGSDRVGINGLVFKKSIIQKKRSANTKPKTRTCFFHAVNCW